MNRINFSISEKNTQYSRTREQSINMKTDIYRNAKKKKKPQKKIHTC